MSNFKPPGGRSPPPVPRPCFLDGPENFSAQDRASEPRPSERLDPVRATLRPIDRRAGDNLRPSRTPLGRGIFA
uniref:Uncharacterized protein n=1 Tax=Anatid alphaherpesvirus 2 TaxID=3080522 RepID=A0AAU0K764_9ALPH